MRYVPVKAFDDLYWYSFNDEPIAAGSPYITPRLSSPAFLLPDETPDAIWHLFAHTWMGIEHYTSTSGLEWKREKLLFRGGHSPFVFHDGSIYYLIFEIHTRTYGRKGEKSSASRIMLSTSTDLMLWSAPRKILDSTAVPFASWRGNVPRLFHPQLVSWEGRYRLYFGAGAWKLRQPDETVAASFGYAESFYPEGPYDVIPEPVIKTDGDNEARSLATGHVRLVPCSDGMAAVECAYYYDEILKKPRSHMLLLESRDGLQFNIKREIQKSPERGWAAYYLTSSDIKYKENEETWYCYYSATGKEEGPNPLVRESLGLLLGKRR